MTSRVSFLVRALIIAGAGFALLLAGLNQANAARDGTAGGDGAGQTGSDQGPIIQATERISIPFGFDHTLPLSEDGVPDAVSGEGACTAGDEITIAYTVTQSFSGASLTDVWNGVCTGELQTWTSEPTATPSPNFFPGAAEACAFAETRDDEGLTDTQEWCDAVLLGSNHVFLPMVLKP